MHVIPHSYPNLTKSDQERVLECFDRDFVGFDDQIDLKIKEKLFSYLEFDHIEITPSGSLALELILKYLKLQHQDEIIISSINCWSVYNQVQQNNALPVVCDVRNTSDFRASYNTITVKITEKTKAIIITHMFGALIEEDIIRNLKLSYPKIIIIEDFSTSLFSTSDYKLGVFSDFGLGSFGSTKPLTGGIGGVLCSHEKIIDNNYDCQKKDLLSFNLKISSLNQTLLLSQLENFKLYQHKKREVISFYEQYVSIYNNDADDLFRAITFDEPQPLVDFFAEIDIELDIRTSVQPNIAKLLKLDGKSNAFNFKRYHSLPLNIKMYNILNRKGLI